MTVHLDAATAAPLHPVALQALRAAQEDGWADPGKLYAQARRARQLLDAASGAAAEVLGVRPDEVTWCPHGSAAVSAAVRGVLTARRRAAAGDSAADASLPRLVHSAVEHSALLKVAERHARPVEVPVDRLGRVDPAAFAAAARTPGTVLAALQSANHEVGTVQPVSAVADECAAAGVPLLVDAAQSVGRVPIPVGWSLLAASARKWGGPAGVGLLVVRKGVRWEDPDGFAGPLNLPAVVAAAASLRAVSASASVESARQSALVARIRSTVAATVPDVEVVGDPDDRLPHIVTFSCLYVDGEALLHALDRHGFAVSSGSACTSDTLRPSHVLAAMGVLTHGNVRVSVHPGVSTEDVDRLLAVLPGVVADLRAEGGVVGL